MQKWVSRCILHINTLLSRSKLFETHFYKLPAIPKNRILNTYECKLQSNVYYLQFIKMGYKISI